MNFTLTGGSFSISLLYGSVSPLPAEDTVITMPFGRVGVVKQVGSTWSSGGMIDTISGPMLPVPATWQTFYAIPNGRVEILSNIISSILSASTPGSATIGGSLTGISPIYLAAFNPRLLNFSYRGTTLQGAVQAANVVLADVIFRKEGTYIVDPGVICPAGGSGTGFGGGLVGTPQYTPFAISYTDIVNISQIIDFSLDVASRLNPALAATINTQLPGQYIYDDQHCQKQPKFTVRCGSPQGTGGNQLIEIPDGWLVDGAYEEWTPPPGTDLTNPASTTSNIYWKIFPSPAGGGAFRGITGFNRILKEIKIPGNVSGFVASPITQATAQGGVYEFVFENPTSEGGFFGFDSSGGVGGVTVNDIISDQQVTMNNAISLVPAPGFSGDASSNFYHIDMEVWTFPLVNPVTMVLGPSTNPFQIPVGVAVISPSQNTVNGYGTGYYAGYVKNYQLINSPRLKTNLTCVYRNYIPQVGDQLVINPTTAIRYTDCGRIQSVSLNFGRGGVTLNILAEKYQFTSGLWNSSISGGIPGGAVIG
jgi:hypothetical protein